MSRLHSEACARNRGPILEALRETEGFSGLVLEIASGTGMHAAHFSERLDGIRWQPTDLSEEALSSTAAWREDADPERFLAPLRLDVLQPPWPVTRADAIFNANMVHISPWQCTLALLAGAGNVLPSGGPLVLYGPFRIEGETFAPSNAQFDRSLRLRDASWGVRSLEEIAAAAETEGLLYESRRSMPANNTLVVFRRGGGS